MVSASQRLSSGWEPSPDVHWRWRHQGRSRLPGHHGDCARVYREVRATPRPRPSRPDPLPLGACSPAPPRPLRLPQMKEQRLRDAGARLDDIAIRERYLWTQELPELTMSIELPPGTSKRDV